MYGVTAVYHIEDPACRVARLESGNGGAFVNFIVVNQADFCVALWIAHVALRPEIEIFLGLVISHNARKNIVYGLAHLLTAAEVLAQVNRRGITRVSFVKRSVTVFALVKELSLRLAEAVDALLDIADHKEIVAAA